jgi:hypothetical protein
MDWVPGIDQAGRDGSTTEMAVMTKECPRAQLADGDTTIDLRGHRLGDLVQALSGCRPETAELAVGAAVSDGQLDPDDALDALAEALVRVRRRPQRPAATA